MSSSRTLLVCIAIASFSFVLWINYSNRNNLLIAKNISVEHANKTHLKTEDNNTPVSIQKDTPVSCSPSNSPLVTKLMRNTKTASSEIDDLMADGYVNPDALLEQARAGKEFAAIAMFKIIRNCYLMMEPPSLGKMVSEKIPVQHQNCPSLPSDVVRNPLKLLEDAANMGSTEAMLFYAMNSRSFSQFYTRKNTNESVQLSRIVLKQAEIYGEQAARDGLLEAYGFMFGAYMTGQFGTRDLTLAYSYGLPLAANKNNPAISGQLSKIGMTLSPLEKTKAEQFTYGCTVNKEANSLNSPFK